MIFELLFQAVEVFIGIVFGIIPNLPATPQAIIDAGATVIGYIGQVGGILVAIYSPPLFIAIVAGFVLLFQFEHIYHLVIWLLRKLPIAIH